MDASRSGFQQRGARATHLGMALIVSAGLLLALVLPATAADPSAVPSSSPNPSPTAVPEPVGLVVEARALLGGHVRPGAWTAVAVHVRNDGPSISGELRIRTPTQGSSVYGKPVELPSTSEQDHVLYAQPPLFGTRLHVDLVSEGRTVLTRDVPIRSHDAYSPIYAILAERPEGLEPGVTGAAANPQGQAPHVVMLSAADLPPRVQAWSAIDRLIWQDVDPRQMSVEQLEALELWVSAGGRLVVVGGTTGVGPVSGLPADLLPFVPTQTVDVPSADLGQLVGNVPPEAPDTVPALAGTLRSGSVLARSGNNVIAAQSTFGHGSVTLVGINPAEAWLADSTAARALWRRLLPAGEGALLNPLNITDDSPLLGVLNNLPSIDLPPIEQLFLLLFAYVALIGPINYVVLRRLDRREWAWVTMPALVGIFAFVSYGMGATLKGSDVIVNEIAIVRAGQGSDRGLAQVYVGVFSPTRRVFDVRVPGGALLTNAGSQTQPGSGQPPLDVLFGETSRLRNFEVGFGVLRGFRTETTAAAPVIEADLRLIRGRVEGTVTNRSDGPLENVAVVYSGGVAILSNLDAGQTRDVTLETSGGLAGYALSERIFGTSYPRDDAQARKVYTRRTVIDQLTGHGPTLFGNAAGGPVLLAWRSGPALEVELVGEQPNRVGESLYVVPLALTLDREAVFNDQTLVKTIVESTGGEAFAEGTSFYLGRGTMTIEIRPGGFDGRFTASALRLALTHGETTNLASGGTDLVALPDAEQPDQVDPVGEPDDPFGQAGFEDLPNLQLFDHGAGRWYEFPPLVALRTYVVSQPERFVDSGGRVRARLVNRSNFGESKYFALVVRLEGTIE